ncbi:hypothetical protein [Lentzea sp. NPDC055074]
MSTLFASFHGTLEPHPWLDPESDRDVYQVFYERSRALGWLDTAWGMNDAGTVHPGGSQDLLAWFQVTALRGGAAHPFLRCAGDVLDRFGEVSLHTVQVLLPTTMKAREPLWGTAPWFVDSAPHARTRVLVTLDGGRSPAVHGLRLLEQEAFEGREVAPARPLPPLFYDEFWNGPPQHRISWEGTLAEWGADGVGFLAAFVQDAAIDHGLDTPCLLTMSRA